MIGCPIRLFVEEDLELWLSDLHAALWDFDVLRVTAANAPIIDRYAKRAYVAAVHAANRAHLLEHIDLIVGGCT